MSKRTILTTIIIPALLISGLIFVLVNNQREYAGELVLTHTALDFGTVPEWEGEVTRVVLARNIGQEPLYIDRIQTGCSYAEIKGPTVIQPNTEETFKINLNPQFLPVEKTTATAILFTDSPKTPQVYLTIVAAAKRFATFSAEVCDFASVVPGVTSEKKVRLCVNEPMNRERIRLLPTENPLLTWEVEPDSSSECFIIRIQLRIPKREDVFDSMSTYSNATAPFSSLLTVAFPNERTLTLPIIWRIVGPVLVQPETLSYGAVSGSTTPRIEFTLSANSDFKILSIQTPEYLQVVETSNTVESTANSGHHKKRFKVSWDLSKSPDLLREEITVMTSVTPVPIRIPVYGYIQSTPSSHNQSE